MRIPHVTQQALAAGVDGGASNSTCAIPVVQQAPAAGFDGGALEPPVHAHQAPAGAHVQGGDCYHMHVQNVQQNVHLDGDMLRTGHAIAVQLHNAELQAAYARHETQAIECQAQAAVANAQSLAQSNNNAVMQYADQAYRHHEENLRREQEQFVSTVRLHQQERESQLLGWEQGQVSEAEASRAREAQERQSLLDNVAE